VSRSDHRPKVGDVWYRVTGSPIGEYISEGVELSWEEWRVSRLTPCGCWLKCLTWPHQRDRFSLDLCGRFASPTKAGALAQLIARKNRHLAILRSQQAEAEITLDLAIEASKAIP
jgi:hypothetical protein